MCSILTLPCKNTYVWPPDALETSGSYWYACNSHSVLYLVLIAHVSCTSPAFWDSPLPKRAGGRRETHKTVKDTMAWFKNSGASTSHQKKKNSNGLYFWIKWLLFFQMVPKSKGGSISCGAAHLLRSANSHFGALSAPSNPAPTKVSLSRRMSLNKVWKGKSLDATTGS